MLVDMKFNDHGCCDTGCPSLLAAPTLQATRFERS